MNHRRTYASAPRGTNDMDTRFEVGDDPYVATTTVTSFRIIEALERHRGATVPELVDELGLASGTVYKHLNTLRTLHYVTREGDEYRLGLGFLELGLTARAGTGLYEQTYDALVDLAESTGGATLLMVPEHGFGVYLTRVVPTELVESPHQEGERVHLHATAGGKAILAHQSDEALDSWLEDRPLPAVTEHTITDAARLRAELRSVRDRRTAYSRGEGFAGWHAVAVPITGADDEVIGAVSVVKPTDDSGEPVDLSEARNILGSVAGSIESKLWV